MALLGTMVLMEIILNLVDHLRRNGITIGRITNLPNSIIWMIPFIFFISFFPFIYNYSLRQRYSLPICFPKNYMNKFIYYSWLLSLWLIGYFGMVIQSTFDSIPLSPLPEVEYYFILILGYSLTHTIVQTILIPNKNKLTFDHYQSLEKIAKYPFIFFLIFNGLIYVILFLQSLSFFSNDDIYVLVISGLDIVVGIMTISVLYYISKRIGPSNNNISNVDKLFKQVTSFEE